jgi:LysR family transcriptional activator of nhaA
MPHPTSLNYKHLQYFWMVVKAGGVARAGERLHVTPQSISGQISLLEEAIGEALLQRQGRKLELTETGRLVFEHADRMFSAGEELKLALRDRPRGTQPQFRVGVADVVVKSLAYRMLRPALDLPTPPRLFCREGRLADLLGELAVHRLDLVLSDRPMPPSLNVIGFNHLLGECGVTFLATAQLARRLRPHFPHSLNEAPMLLPGEDSAVRGRLMMWLSDQRISPRVVGEFEDSALLKAFGEAGTGVFAMPAVVAERVMAQFDVVAVGETLDVVEQVYAITTERRLTHPAVVAIGQSAHHAFGAAGGRDGATEPSSPARG